MNTREKVRVYFNNNKLHAYFNRYFKNERKRERLHDNKPEELKRTPIYNESTEMAQKGASTLFLDKINQNRTCNSCYYTNSRVSASRGEREGSTEEYLLDSGATTHVMTTDVNAIAITNTTGYVLVGNGEKCTSSKVAEYVLEEIKSKQRIKIRDAVIIPDFEKNIISMLRMTDDGYEFDITKERCIITKYDDPQVRIELKPGEKGAYYLHDSVAGRMVP